MTMKRNILVLIVVLFAVGAGYLLIVRMDRAADPLEFLPGDTLALIDLRQPAALYGKYRQSRLGQRLAAIRWGDLLLRFDASEEVAGSFQREIDQIQAFLDGPVFRALFARRAVLALLPAESGSMEGSAPWESLVLIAEPRPRTEVVALLAPLLGRDRGSATERYQGREIRTFILADGTVLAVAASDGLLLASLSLDAVKRCLDLALDPLATEQDRLNNNQDYQALRKRSGDRDRPFAYGDMRALTSLAASIAQAGPAMAESSTPPGDGGFRHGALYCGTETGRLDCTAVLLGAPGEAVTVMPEPALDDSLAAVPSVLLFHSWTNLLDLPRLAAEVQHNPQTRDAFKKSDEWLGRKTGMSFSEFFSLFGSRISLTVTAMRGNGFFPLPRLVCRLAVKEEEGLRQALVSLQDGKVLASREFDGIRIHTLMLAGGLLQPSWAIRDGYVYFADSPEQLEQSLGQPEEPLLGSPLFRQVDVALAEPNNMTAYVNYPLFLDGMQQIAAWGANILTMMDQERGGKARALVDLVLTPVFDGMKMFAVGSSRLLAEPSELVLESVLIIADGAGEEK